MFNKNNNKEDRTYEVDIKCTNCGDKDIHEQLFGKPVTEEQLNMLVCDRCGCKGVRIKDL